MKVDYASGLSALGDIDLAQDRLDNAAKNYRESLQLNQQLNDQAGQAVNNSALASLALEQARPAEAETLASQAADAFQVQKNSDLEMDALCTLARALLAGAKLSEARKAIERAKGLPAQDESIRLRLAITDAYLLAREGKVADASRLLTETTQKASERKWKRSEFEAILARTEIESQTGAMPSTRLLARRLQSDANAAGFALIARKAGALAN